MGGAERYDAITVEAVLGEGVYQTAFILSLIAGYILFGLSLYAIGRRRGIRGSWLAWVPIGNLWLLGSLSDQYQYLVKGKINIRRKMLLGLSLVTAGLYAACACTVLWAMQLEGTGAEAAAVATLLAFIMLFAVLAGVIAILIYMYICCYDLFRSCDPDNGVLFLVLSVLSAWALPVIAFAIRKRDGGMPPRKQPTPAGELTEETEGETEEETEGETEEETEEETEGDPNDEQEIPVADA